MNKEEGKKLLADIRANNAKLNACSLHDFSIDATPERQIDKRWRCTRCGGEVFANSKTWYDKGIQHAGFYEAVAVLIDIANGDGPADVMAREVLNKYKDGGK